MIINYIGVNEINGSLVVIDGVKDASFEEIVDIQLDNGAVRQGRIVQIEGERIVVQVFEGTRSISLNNTTVRLTGHPMEMPLSPEIIGRVLDGAGRPIDGLGDIYPATKRNINGTAINPVSRVYPRNYINTGISGIDVLTTLIRGQKLPIFSGSGMKHNELAVQIVRQAKIAGADKSNFGVVFAAMGVKNDVARFFRKSFEDAGVLNHVVMFLNLSNDPIIERILTPRCALTAAEYLAFELNMHILVIMTDMTSYAEALREFSSSKGEIPGRKGFPGYLYSDLGFILLGDLVEHVSGQRLDIFVEKHFYEPMGLCNTHFLPLENGVDTLLIAPTELAANSPAHSHIGATRAPTSVDTLAHSHIQGYVHDPNAFVMGGVSGHAGLFSTADDIAQILQMLVDGGMYKGRRYLREETIDLFNTQHYKESGCRRGLGFDKPVIKTGGGPCCDEAPQESYGHTGFTGTYVWVDPVNRLTYVFLSNRVHPSATPNRLAQMNIRTKIQSELYRFLKEGDNDKDNKENKTATFGQ